MPRQMSLMVITIFPDGYISSRFLLPSGFEKMAFNLGDSSDIPCLLIVRHHSLCTIPRHYPITVIVIVWKRLSALANFDKCNIRLKIT